VFKRVFFISGKNQALTIQPKIMKLNIFLLLITVFLITGCKKEKQQPATKQQLLTKKSWILKEYTGIRLSDGVTTDLYASMNPCEKDDEYVFIPDNTFEVTNGYLRCGSAPYILQQGDWQFTDNETVIEILIRFGVGTAGRRKYKIALITDTELKFIDSSKPDYEYFLTFSH
jgi:hypothetical protein